DVDPCLDNLRSHETDGYVLFQSSSNLRQNFASVSTTEIGREMEEIRVIAEFLKYAECVSYGIHDDHSLRCGTELIGNAVPRPRLLQIEAVVDPFELVIDLLRIRDYLGDVVESFDLLS